MKRQHNGTWYKQHFRVQMRDNRNSIPMLPRTLSLYKFAGDKTDTWSVL